MAGIWMAIGVNYTLTGSFDTYWNAQMTPNNYNYAYLGITPPNTPSNKFTWPTGSRGNTALKDLQMYTPYPTGTERGKLYFVQLSSFTTDYNAINVATGVASRFVSLTPPPGDLYYIITPSLNTGSLANGSHIAQYAFVDEDDLFANGWKSQRGTPDSSNPLASEATWTLLVNDTSWLNPPFSFAPGTPGDKAKIVANVLAYTENSHTIQTTLGLSAANLVKGAVVLGGANSPFASDPAYAGIVPLLG